MRIPIYIAASSEERDRARRFAAAVADRYEPTAAHGARMTGDAEMHEECGGCGVRRSTGEQLPCTECKHLERLLAEALDPTSPRHQLSLDGIGRYRRRIDVAPVDSAALWEEVYWTAKDGDA